MKRFLVLGSLVVITVCDGGLGVVPCTSAGCGSALRIEIRGDLPPNYAVTLEAPGMEPVEFECRANPCFPFVAPGFTPETVTVRLEGEGLEFTETFTPTYVSVFPNGPDCPPECRQATIVVEVP